MSDERPAEGGLVKLCCGTEWPVTQATCGTCGDELVARERPVVPQDSGSQRSIESAAAAVCAFEVHWPWGPARYEAGHLVVGRVPPAPDELAQQLEAGYRNVSRIHAELEVIDGELMLRDLQSLNRTWMNRATTQLTPFRRVAINDGDVINFGGRLEVTVRVFRASMTEEVPN